MAYVYLHTENDRFTVGFHRPDGEFFAESDHQTRDDAARRVHYLNGGN